MLSSWPRWRIVVAISYGCIGRSARQASTASASGFPTFRLDNVTERPASLDYPKPNIRLSTQPASFRFTLHRSPLTPHTSTMATVVQVSISPGGVPKMAVPEAEVTPLGLEGDLHADVLNHGGPDRALCLY